MLRIPKSIQNGLTTLVAGYALILGGLMIFEDQFIFFPAPYPDGDWDAAKHSGMPYEEVWFTTEDNVRIHGWWLPAPKPTKDTVLFLHGNAGNLTGRFFWMKALTTLPANVLIIDYRGYGRSEGSPNEEGVNRDADAAWQYLTEERGIAAQTITVYGNSLGGGIASGLVLKRACKALILASTFTSIPDMATRQMPFVPKSLVRTQLNTLERLPDIKVPVLIIHSRADSMIPIEMARENFAAANQPKQLLELESANHNEVTFMHQKKLLETIQAFLAATESTP